MLEMMCVPGMEIAKHIFKAVKVFSASCVKASWLLVLISIHRLLKLLKRVEERREKMIVGKRMILVMM